MSDAETAAPPVRPHPFAGYVRTIARGAQLSRPLDEDEAQAAMAMILAGEVEPVQIGALLGLLRYRKETPAELAGFVRAARDRIAAPQDAAVDLDWPSYADRHRQNPYFALAALLLADAGVRVAMHGIAGAGPATTPKALAALGIGACASLDEAASRLDGRGFAYLPLSAFCPDLDRLFGLRPLLGVRTAVNTFARDLNPLGARCQIQGVFHPAYLPTHCETARRLGLANAAIFKGGGGEAQRNPEKPCRIATLREGAPGEEKWPAMLPKGERHPWRDEPLDPARVAALWRGEWQAPGPVAAVVGSAAIALRVLGRAATIEAAEAMARDLWAERDRARYGAA
ncbi:MAG: glycosyl transferase family protein [Alphaproteobacteria bacterium]